MLDLQIVSDLKTLRTLAEYLLILDPVTFLGYLENLRAAESINSIWLFHDAAHTIFEQVKAATIAWSSFCSLADGVIALDTLILALLKAVMVSDLGAQ